ncbi:hypothetical protein GCM10027073_04700 [Streptomyces chlorus]|uniref:Recombinase family protein n=1 Tax=Streptomyces chlorus TaxID=887452 RepID=A0ABW1DX57_9ACTN
MLIGYARVSTADQNPDHQIDALLRAGVDRDNIHVDTASGAKPESTDENRTRAALVQVSGPIEPFRAFTSQVKIDYPPKDWLTWEDTVCPP